LAALQKLLSVGFGWAAASSSEGWVPTQPAAAGKRVRNITLWSRAKGVTLLGAVLETFPWVTPMLGGEGEFGDS